MSKRFIESEHKRDERGRFAEMDTSELKKRQMIELEDRERVSTHNEEAKRSHIEKVGAEYNLTSKEVNAVHKYVNSFNDGWYRKINQQLRDGVPLSKEDEETCKYLDSALDKMPKFEGALLRVIDLKGEALEKFLGDHKKGNIVKYKGYTSTSSSKVAQAQGNIYISIANAKNGVDLRKFNASQEEILYKRNSLFYVKNIEYIEGIYYILIGETQNEKQ